MKIKSRLSCLDKIESIIYQTGVMTWKVILFDVSDKNWRKLIIEDEKETRFEAEAFAKQTEDKLVYNLDPSDIK